MPLTVYTAAKLPIKLEDKPLATPGGEGAVYRVKSTGVLANSCVKIYHQHRQTSVRKNKIEFMIKNKPSVVYNSNFIICWPTEMVFDINKNFVGFMMPLAFSGSEELYKLTRLQIPKNLSKFDRVTLSGIENRLKVCVNIAIAIHSIHESCNYAIVDYKPQNILITNEGKISITDVDSFQIVQNGNVLFYAEVATPEYAPPESSQINPSKTLIPESWDRFSLAVSFYEILLGIHPFAATCDGQYYSATTIGEKIQKGLFVHGSKKVYLSVIPPIHNNFQYLPKSLGLLFIQAFEDGHANKLARPTSEKWGQVIHKELIKKSEIKGFPTSAHQNKKITAISGSQSVTKSNAPNLIPVVVNPPVPPKENYMIWKILTALVTIILVIAGVNISETNSQLGILNSRISSLESIISSKDLTISQLESSQSSTENDFTSQIWDLQNAVDKIGSKYPISIKEFTFNNVSKDNHPLSSSTQNFQISNIQYVQPVIKFKSNLRIGGEYNINYKFLLPDGTLLNKAGAPFGFTWQNKINISGDFKEDNIEMLTGIGLSSNIPGRYTVEIWCNEVLIGESYFNVND
jgi:hypothetical protein